MIYAPIFMIMIYFLPIYGQHAEELFLQANKYVEHHEYKNALALYQKIEPKGVAVLFNMGKCYQKLEEYPSALGSFMAALKQASFLQREQIDAEIKEVKNSLQQQAKKTFSEEWFYYFLLFFKTSSLFILQLFFLILFALYAYSLRIKQKHATLLHGCMGVLLGILCVGMGLRSLQESCIQGVVLSADTAIYAGPDFEYQSLGVLQPGNIVFIDQTCNEWCKVREQNGIEGWLLGEKLYKV